MYVWLSSSAAHLKLLPTVLTGYTPVQNKHFLKTASNSCHCVLLIVLVVGTVEIMWHFKASFLLFRPTLLRN